MWQWSKSSRWTHLYRDCHHILALQPATVALCLNPVLSKELPYLLHLSCSTHAPLTTGHAEKERTVQFTVLFSREVIFTGTASDSRATLGRIQKDHQHVGELQFPDPVEISSAFCGKANAYTVQRSSYAMAHVLKAWSPAWHSWEWIGFRRWTLVEGFGSVT
jgi:hypothetical protein